MQGVNFQGFDPGFEWSDISPRLGVSYVFDWEKRLLLRANYGHYVDALGSGIVSYNLPLTYVNVKYEWDDANDNDLVDAGELPNTACTDAIDFLNIDPCNTGAASSPFQIDPDLEAPEVDEFIVGAEYELARDFTIGTNLTMRQRDNIVWTPFYDAQQFAANGQLVQLFGSNVYDCNNTVTQADFDPQANPSGRTFSEPYCVLANPADPRLGTARARVEANMPGYTQEYQGIELTATKRLSNKWMMRGFLSWNDWTNDFSGEAVTPGIYGVGASAQSGDPTNLRGGTADNGGLVAVQSLASGNKRNVFVGSSQWQFNVNGLYQLPKSWSVSGNLYGRQGYGLADYVPVSANATGEGTKSVQVDSIDSNRYDDLFLLDLRVAKLFTLERNTNVEIAAEVFNVTNTDTVLQQENRITGTQDPTTLAFTNTYQRIGEIVSPRVLRLVATINF
jgi:hypothetical protein